MSIRGRSTSETSVKGGPQGAWRRNPMKNERRLAALAVGLVLAN